MKILDAFLLFFTTVNPVQLIGIIALSAIFLAGFAIHVVHSVVQKGKDK